MSPRSSLQTETKRYIRWTSKHFDKFLGLLLILFYINDLSENLASYPKLFADDTSLFSVVKKVDASNFDLNNDLKKIGEWGFE